MVFSFVNLYIQDYKDRQWELSPKMSVSVRFSSEQIPGNNVSYLNFSQIEFTGWGLWEAKGGDDIGFLLSVFSRHFKALKKKSFI